MAYAVSMAAQKIASNPREAAARAEHVVKYLRSAPAVSLHYKVAGDSWGKWNHLRHKQTSTTVEVYTDASFAADEQCRSFGSVQLYWGGALVSWAAGRQSLIAAHTAESELYSLSEGHLMGKAFRPTVAALMNVSERDVICHLYCDNSAAVQLCTLESGSWRTRHLRLRGAVIRQDLENDAWSLAHLDGVYMPADLGTKPVGPARLEDLVKVCDLWAPHLEQSSDPPRPSVAAVRSMPSGFMSTLLALIMVAQVISAKATRVEVEDGELLSHVFSAGFVLGLGIGFGWGLANCLCVLFRCCCERFCMQRYSRTSSSERPRRTQYVQTVREDSRDMSETGECDPFPIQSEGVLQEIGAEESAWLLQLHEQMYSMHSCDRGSGGASGSGDPGYSVRALQQGALEEAALVRITDSWRLGGVDVREAYVQGPARDLEYVRRPHVLPPSDMLAQARAPTVPRPPDYPGQVEGQANGANRNQANRVVYGDDEGWLESDNEDESSIGEWTTDSGMPRGRSSSSGGSAGSRRSGRSVAVMSVAASLHSASGHQLNGGQESGSWELMIVLGLVIVCSVLVGVVCAWMCCLEGQRRLGRREPLDCQEIEKSSKVQSGEGSEKPAASLSSVVNITVTGSPTVDRSGRVEVDVTGGEGLRRRGQLTEGAEPTVGWCSEESMVSSSTLHNTVGRGKGERGSQSRVAAESRTLSHCGLDPGRQSSGKVSEETLGATATSRNIGPCGLGPSRPEPARTSDEASVRSRATNPHTLGPCGLGSESRAKARGSEEAPRTTTAASSRPLSPFGLGPSRAKASEAVSTEGDKKQVESCNFGGSAAASSEPVRSRGVSSVEPARWSVDRVRRPVGVKQKIILSCGVNALQPLVYLTQNGECLHSGICRPMQCAGTPIQRSLCRFCFQAGQLPSRRVEGRDADRCVYFTRSGHYVHSSSDCVCIDPLEEVLSRKLCRCCRWLD